LFLLCGLVTLFTCVPYLMLRGAELPFQSEWIIFVIVLALIGGFSASIAMLPASRIAKICKTESSDSRIFLSALKKLGYFSFAGYLIAVIAYSAPHSWNLNPQFMFPLCPMYFVKMTFDPSPSATALLLAPMNAAVYGALGLTTEYVWLVSRRNHAG
jgi:hypothetical protein